MKTFKKFPSIIQYSGVVKHIRAQCHFNSLPLPVIEFSGSIKAHGTNSGIGFAPDGEVWFQSRERLISFESDNAGFAAFGEQNQELWKTIYKKICDDQQLEHDQLYIFGEWLGGNIQKGVALNQIQEKKFGIFEMVFVKGEETFTIDPIPYHEFINGLLPNVVVLDAIVPPLTLSIDFSAPHLVQNYLLEETMKVEAECPIGKFYGFSGIGEGIVWTAKNYDNVPKFKVKGELHSVSKVKTVHELTDAEIASKENSAEFVEYACSQNRLEQGIAKLGEMGLEVEMKSMGAFLKWLFNDILTECKDVILESKLERKDIMPKIADKARNWFINYANTEMGIV
jgi:hypothetical protein